MYTKCVSVWFGLGRLNLNQSTVRRRSARWGAGGVHPADSWEGERHRGLEEGDAEAHSAVFELVRLGCIT